MKNPESVEFYTTPAPAQTQNAEGDPLPYSYGGHGPFNQPNSDDSIDMGGTTSLSSVWNDPGTAADNGTSPVGSAVDTVNSADTMGTEDVGAPIDLSPSTLAELSDHGGYSRPNTPVGGETRAESTWPDGGLRGASDSEAIDRMGIDEDK